MLSVGAARIELPPELAPIASAHHAEADAHYTPGYHYLIRPDGYVALSSRGDAPEGIVAWLRGIAA